MKLHKRQLLQGAAAFGALAAWPAAAATRDYVKRDLSGLPNLLLITADDVDWSALGFMNGRDALTPNLDALARRSHVFEQVRTVAPICMPSRQAFMSGRLPHRNGGNGFFPMHEGTPTLCSILANEGYYCAASHKIGHMQPASSFPWDMKSEGKDRHPLVHAAFTRLAITEAQAQYRPFFINCNINDPHRPFYGSPEAVEIDHGQQGPYRVPRPLGPDDVDVPPNLDNLPAVRAEIAQYWNSAQRRDMAVGNILRALEESGAADNTIVLFVSDHGMPFPFAKATCYDHGIRTPVVLHVPGNDRPRRHDALATNLDILPTLLDLLGIERAPGFDGNSWRAAIDGGAMPERLFVMSYVDYVSSGHAYPSRTLQDRRFALHFAAWADGKTRLRLESMWGLTFPAMAEAARTDPQMAARVDQYVLGVPLALYDMATDPGQRVNLISDPAHAERAAAMKALLLAEMERTGDPQLANYRLVLDGKIPVIKQNPDRYRIAGD